MSYLLFTLLVSCFSRNLYSFAEQITKQDNGQELLLCRKCGADVADSHYIFTKQSPGSRKIEKQQLFGRQNVTVQTLVNPYGVNFEVITLTKARCENIGTPQGADSWFPGYKWRICACSQCGQHLGWTFEGPSNAETTKDHVHSFHGIILANVLGENFTDSLIMMPKMFKM